MGRRLLVWRRQGIHPPSQLDYPSSLDPAGELAAHIGGINCPCQQQAGLEKGLFGGRGHQISRISYGYYAINGNLLQHNTVFFDITKFCPPPAWRSHEAARPLLKINSTVMVWVPKTPIFAGLVHELARSLPISYWQEEIISGHSPTGDRKNPIRHAVLPGTPGS